MDSSPGSISAYASILFFLAAFIDLPRLLAFPRFFATVAGVLLTAASLAFAWRSCALLRVQGPAAAASLLLWYFRAVSGVFGSPFKWVDFALLPLGVCWLWA